MTQDEVDQIYDYLHENYEYRDGELIRKTSKQNNTIGEIRGFIGKRDNNYCMQTSINVNGKKFRASLKKLIYLFHMKCYPQFLINIDGNVANNKIENLKEISKYESELPKLINYKDKSKVGSCYCKDKKKYRASIKLNKKIIFIGYFLNDDQASEAYKDIHNLFYIIKKV